MKERIELNLTLQKLDNILYNNFDLLPGEVRNELNEFKQELKKAVTKLEDVLFEENL